MAETQGEKRKDDSSVMDVQAGGKSPAFQFYPADFLSDEQQTGLSLAETGAYIRLLCRCWLEGSIPDDVSRAARLAGAAVLEFKKLWPAVRACFIDHPERPGRLTHPRLERERLKQAIYRRRQRDAAAVRWNRKSHAVGLPPHMPLHQTDSDVAVPTQCSSSSSSSSSSDSSQREEAPVVRLRGQFDPAESDELADRARELLENYSTWFYAQRKGARYMQRPHLDYPEALNVVRTWPDDARIKKMADIFLSTDEPWIEKTDRSFGLFARKATWCDDKLRQWEIANGLEAAK